MNWKGEPMEKSRTIELLKLAVPIKALTQQEYADFVEAVNMGMDALKEQLSKEGTTSDLISRTATIDAVNNAFDRETLLTGFVRSIAVRAIRDMPSAQPEPKWIPVSERLPKDGTWNIFTDGKNISVERYKEDAIDHFFPAGRWFQLEDVIAWMPLPEPYKPNK